MSRLSLDFGFCLNGLEGGWKAWAASTHPYAYEGVSVKGPGELLRAP